jgi:hypothetical protein
MHPGKDDRELGVIFPALIEATPEDDFFGCFSVFYK